jgi:hypothetical protein
VDILGDGGFASDLLAALGLINTSLVTVNSNLQLIYERLEHVEIDSFVNVRVMDETGDLPIPSTIATGLLVSAFAGPGVQHVIVDSGNVGVSGTPANPVYVATTPFEPFVIDSSTPVNVNVFSPIPLPIEGHVIVDSGSSHVTVDNSSLVVSGTINSNNYLTNVENSAWEPALGYHPSTVSWTAVGGDVTTSVGGGAGVVPMAFSTGMDKSSGKNARVQTNLVAFASSQPYGASITTPTQPLA